MAGLTVLFSVLIYAAPADIWNGHSKFFSCISAFQLDTMDSSLMVLANTFWAPVERQLSSSICTFGAGLTLQPCQVKLCLRCFHCWPGGGLSTVNTMRNTSPPNYIMIQWQRAYCHLPYGCAYVLIDHVPIMEVYA